MASLLEPPPKRPHLALWRALGLLWSLLSGLQSPRVPLPTTEKVMASLLEPRPYRPHWALWRALVCCGASSLDLQSPRVSLPGIMVQRRRPSKPQSRRSSKRSCRSRRCQCRSCCRSSRPRSTTRYRFLEQLGPLRFPVGFLMGFLWTLNGPQTALEEAYLNLDRRT